MARGPTSKVMEETRPRGSSTSHGMFSRLNLTVECPTEFGQTVHVSGSSFLAGVSNPSLVSDLCCLHVYERWAIFHTYSVRVCQDRLYLDSTIETVLIFPDRLALQYEIEGELVATAAAP